MYPVDNRNEVREFLASRRARITPQQAGLALDRALLHEQSAGVAHELNNPLQGVLGHLELMRATGEAGQ